MLLGKLDIHIQKNEARSLSLTLDENQLQMNRRTLERPTTLKRKTISYQHTQAFPEQYSLQSLNRVSNWQVGIHEIKKLLTALWEASKWRDKTGYRMVENLHYLYSWEDWYLKYTKRNQTAQSINKNQKWTDNSQKMQYKQTVKHENMFNFTGHQINLHWDSISSTSEWWPLRKEIASKAGEDVDKEEYALMVRM